MALTRNPNAEISVDEVRKVMAQHAKQSQAEVESGGQIRKLDQVNASLERVSEELDLLNAGVAELQEAVRQARSSHELLTGSLRFYSRTVMIGSVLFLITAGAVLWILGGEAGMLPNLPSFGASARVEEKPAMAIEKPWWEQAKTPVEQKSVSVGPTLMPEAAPKPPVATMQVIPTPAVKPAPAANSQQPTSVQPAANAQQKTSRYLLFDSVRHWQLAGASRPIGDALRVATAAPASKPVASASAASASMSAHQEDPAAWWDEFIRNHRGAEWWTPLTPEADSSAPVNLSKEHLSGDRLSSDHLSKVRRSALPDRSR